MIRAIPGTTVCVLAWIVAAWPILWSAVINSSSVAQCGSPDPRNGDIVLVAAIFITDHSGSPHIGTRCTVSTSHSLVQLGLSRKKGTCSRVKLGYDLTISETDRMALQIIYCISHQREQSNNIRTAARN